MIRLQNVSKTFGSGSTALDDINIDIEKGEFVFLVGHTGSGKTTLLRLLVREVIPTQGSILIDDYDIVKLPSNKIPQLRQKIGVVFQDLKLLMDRTILENITLPMEVAGVSVQQAVQRAEELLNQVSILEHKEKFPIQLSGGELQRVAIARALALSPDILLADEPTGNLDEKTAFEIVDLLSNINDQGTTVIMATHNMDIVERLKRRLIALEKGKVIVDKPKDKKEPHKDHKKHSEHEKAKEEVVKSEEHSQEKEVKDTPSLEKETVELEKGKGRSAKSADLPNEKIEKKDKEVDEVVKEDSELEEKSDSTESSSPLRQSDSEVKEEHEKAS